MPPDSLLPFHLNLTQNRLATTKTKTSLKKKSLTQSVLEKSVVNFNDNDIGKYLQQSFVDQISSSSSQHNIHQIFRKLLFKKCWKHKSPPSKSSDNQKLGTRLWLLKHPHASEKKVSGETIYFSRFSGEKKGRGERDVSRETEAGLQAAGEHRRLPQQRIIPGAGSSPPSYHREPADSSPLSQGARGGPLQSRLGAALSATGRRPGTRSLGTKRHRSPAAPPPPPPVQAL